MPEGTFSWPMKSYLLEHQYGYRSAKVDKFHLGPLCILLSSLQVFSCVNVCQFIQIKQKKNNKKKDILKFNKFSM